jgi:hypothetical protein
VLASVHERSDECDYDEQRKAIHRTIFRRAAIHNTPELRAALIYAAIGLGFDRADAPHSANESEDRTVGKVLADLVRQLGADL